MRKHLVELRRILQSRFDLEELRILCFDLDLAPKQTDSGSWLDYAYSARG